MRLAHRFTGCALLMAGTFGLYLVAQESRPPAAVAPLPVEAPPPPPPPPPVEPVSRPADSGLRLAEIQVELAWLADPATFPCQLAAQARNGVMEVSGVVATEELRRRAFDVARSSCSMMIVDKMIVQANSALPITSVNEGQLCCAAGALLSRARAEYDEHFEFNADSQGQITVAGTVPSHEAKLDLSRRLSRLPGCTAVVNLMMVHPDRPRAIPATVANRPSAPVQARAALKSPAPQPAVQSSVAQPKSPGLLAKFIGIQPHSRRPVAPPVVKSPYAGGVPPRAAPVRSPYQCLAVQKAPAMGPPPRPTTAQSAPLVTRPLWRTGPGGTQLVTQGPSWTAATPVARAARNNNTGTTGCPQQQNLPCPCKPGESVASKTKARPQAAGVTQVVYQAAPAASRPQGSPVTQLAYRLPAAAAHLPPAASQPQCSPVTQVAYRLTRPQGSLVTQLAYRLPAAAAHLPTAVPAAPTAQQAIPAQELERLLVERIKSVCGDWASQSSIHAKGSNHCLVELVVPTHAKGQELAEKIMALPGLEPYRVDLHIAVKQ